MLLQLLVFFQVPPNLLVKHGVSVTRTVQQPGQFLVEFPRSYTSNVCTGYSLSESVFFAPPDYVDSAGTEFQNIRESAEPMMFPLAKLLVYIAEVRCACVFCLCDVRTFPVLTRVPNEYE